MLSLYHADTPDFVFLVQVHLLIYAALGIFLINSSGWPVLSPQRADIILILV
jgi:hypothetical protein